MRTVVKGLLNVAWALAIVATVVAPVAADGDNWQLGDSGPAVVRAQPPYADLALLSGVDGQFDVWVPADWRLSDQGKGGDTVLILTPADGSGASFTIMARQADKQVTVFDIPALAARFSTLVQALPGSQAAWQARWLQGSGYGFEARHSFADGDTQAQRWVRQIYAGDREYLLVAQAASSTDFNLYTRQFLAMMLTFRVR